MENKNPPKKLKKKLPKEPLSGGGEKKMKTKGECPGDRDGLSPARPPLGSVLAGPREAPRTPSLSRAAQGLQSHRPLPRQSPPRSALSAALTLSPPCPRHCPFPSPGWLLTSSSVPAEDKSDPDSKAKSAKSTKKEPMSVFQVKKEKKNKKKGTGRAGGGGSQSCCLMASP